MQDLAKRRTFPTSPAEFPDWLAELPGYADLVGQLRDSAKGKNKRNAKGELWQVSMMLPVDLSEWAEAVDPLVMLATLAYGTARIDEKMSDVVQASRSAGKSWSQIGEVLGMSKQAAWERFSGED